MPPVSAGRKPQCSEPCAPLFSSEKKVQVCSGWQMKGRGLGEPDCHPRKEAGGETGTKKEE